MRVVERNGDEDLMVNPPHLFCSMRFKTYLHGLEGRRLFSFLKDSYRFVTFNMANRIYLKKSRISLGVILGVLFRPFLLEDFDENHEKMYEIACSLNIPQVACNSTLKIIMTVHVLWSKFFVFSYVSLEWSTLSTRTPSLSASWTDSSSSSPEIQDQTIIFFAWVRPF